MLCPLLVSLWLFALVRLSAPSIPSPSPLIPKPHHHRLVLSLRCVSMGGGRGCMGMTAFYGNFDRDEQEPESLRVISKALELGINFLDTAWIYQNFSNGKLYTNEELVGKAIAMHGRDKFVIATKFGIAIENGERIICGKEDFIRKQLGESLQRLGTDYIDLYYMHRMDPSTPIEETMAVLKALVEEGRIKYVGLSECTPNELRRAHAVHPITAIQMEWSLQTRDIENTVLPVARELGVGIVAYSPLGRGFLADLAMFENLPAGDVRTTMPRFTGENKVKNMQCIQRLFDLAAERKCAPAQLALAWLHAQGEDVFPIPGTKSTKRIVENAMAFSLLPLSEKEMQDITAAVEQLQGDRYPAGMQGTSFNNRL